MIHENIPILDNVCVLSVLIAKYDPACVELECSLGSQGVTSNYSIFGEPRTE